MLPDLLRTGNRNTCIVPAFIYLNKTRYCLSPQTAAALPQPLETPRRAPTSSVKLFAMESVSSRGLPAKKNTCGIQNQGATGVRQTDSPAKDEISPAVMTARPFQKSNPRSEWAP